MKVLIVGSGAREHAFAWRCATSESVSSVVVAPGNAGIATEPGVTTAEGPVTVTIAESLGADLVIVGPEAPLVNGLADDLRAAGIAVVGPGTALARLEGSKAFAKEFMTRHGIPTAEYRVCTTEAQARAAVSDFGVPVVIKADGLAAGKGVAVCESEAQAEAAIVTMMEERVFGEAGDTLVVERRLTGFEASVIVMADESGYLMLPAAQDHKQIGEGGSGPNTGGMGAVCPNPHIDPALLAKIEREIVQPSVAAIRGNGGLFRGFLFIGLMIENGTPRVLEYNVRFGDPEAQAILPQVEGDFGVLLRALADGRLLEGAREAGFAVAAGHSVAVVAASAGYPGSYARGIPIRLGVPSAASALAGRTRVFTAGVSATTDGLETAGGRVLTVCATAETLDEARVAAYARLGLVSFDGMQFRPDIGGEPLGARLYEEADQLLARFHKRGGYLPVVVQDVAGGEVLMVGYANATALEETRRTGRATFFSTSRNELWTKGATSGDILAVEEVRVDCDQDALLYRVRLLGAGACHTTNQAGERRRSCFYRRVERDGALTQLDP